MSTVIQASADTDLEETAVARRDNHETSDRELVAKLVDQARADGVELVGENGLLGRLTKLVLESALEGEITDHLGYDKHDPAGRGAGNSRNGTRAKTVLTDVGPVEITVPRDRDASFEPKIVRKRQRQRRLSGVDEMVISLSAKGLTTGEISAHLAEVYGAEVSKQTISTITDNDHPKQVGVPPKKPGKDAAPEMIEAFDQARKAQSSARICVEHAIGENKKWRSLQRWTGRREDLPETVEAIASLVSDRAAMR